MHINLPKIRRKTPRNEAKGGPKSLRQVIFSFFWRQSKWLVWSAIILSVFLVLDSCCEPPFKEAWEKPSLFAQEEVEVVSGQLTAAIGQASDQTKIRNMGGPMTLGSLLSPMAQASVDFSMDDDFEEYDLLISQDSALMPSVNPSGTINFAGFRREILYYVVKKGDVPETIAASFDINSDTLLWANGLHDGSIIKPGQELMVLPINGVRVKVGSKDTIASLAKKYNGDHMEIIAFNELPLDGALKAGDFLIIPDGEAPAPATPRYSVPTNKYAQSTIPVGWLIWPTSGYNWGRIHGQNGVDIASSCGTPIYAAAAGKVTLSDGVGYNGGYGKYVKIQHSNGVTTLYAHASQLLISTGAEVGQGQLIMLMGTTGRSTGCHLHFEVRGATNPLTKKK